MKFSIAALAALAAPSLAQGPPAVVSSVLASLSGAGVIPTNGPPAEWSSAFESLKSEGIIPSTVTAPPYPTGSWGPGNGPWGPGGPGGTPHLTLCL